MKRYEKNVDDKDVGPDIQSLVDPTRRVIWEVTLVIKSGRQTQAIHENVQDECLHCESISVLAMADLHNQENKPETLHHWPENDDRWKETIGHNMVTQEPENHANNKGKNLVSSYLVSKLTKPGNAIFNKHIKRYR